MGKIAIICLALSLVFPARAAVHYVDAASTAPVPPYATWAAAATTIQDAVDAAVDGDEIVVTNGVYTTGGRSWDGNVLNRVAVTNALTLRSVNGPAVTVIQGYQTADLYNGYAATRCVYLVDGASLSGFTLAGGTTFRSSGYTDETCGGGVWSSSLNTLITNCVFSGNSCKDYGGGAFQGTLNNCLLTNNNSSTLGGATYGSAVSYSTLVGNSAGDGGAAWAGALTNCLVLSNSASGYGGGVRSATLVNCALTGNRASNGGGAANATLFNCTLTGNTASSRGGGSFIATLYNSIIYYNSDPAGLNNSGSTLTYCCSPDSTNGTGNLSVDPQMVSAWHLSAGSPCRGAGSDTYAAGVDIDDQPWAVPPSIGCDEYTAGTLTGALAANIVASKTTIRENAALSFWADITGTATSNAWNFGDGTVQANKLQATHAWTNAGDYTVVLTVYNESNPGGVHTNLPVRVYRVATHYVSLTSARPTAPYTNWATAATSIQNAVDVALDGDEIVVTNGTYATGGRTVTTVLTNRVVVTNLLTLRSVNGPAVTVIRGSQVSGATNGPAAVRCVYLADGVALIGFTLTNGATLAASTDGRGGGVWCASVNTLVSNCVISGNAGYDYGGGAYSGTLQSCVLSGNSAQYGGGASQSTLTNCTLSGNAATLQGGGAYSSTLNNCTLAGNVANSLGGGAYNGSLNNSTLTGNVALASGGGTYNSMVINCTLSGNSAVSHGGGAYSGTLTNCTLTGNSATAYAASYGGGADSCTAYNCVFTGNSAFAGGGSYYGWLAACAYNGNRATRGGGSYGGTLNNCTLVDNLAVLTGGGTYQGGLNNCIVYYNSAPTNANYDSSTLRYCCATPLAAGTGNLAVDPLLSSLYHLSANSPCRGAGSASYARGVDLDGEAWASPPSIGCDELVPGSATGPLSITIQPDSAVGTNDLTAGFLANVVGKVTATVWNFGDGTFATNQAILTHTWLQAGTYTVVLTAYNDSHPSGVSVSLPFTLTLPNRHYVNAASVSPVAPYSTWATAAVTIQDAVDAAAAGDEVVVTNGLYSSGGRVVSGSLTNRVAVTNAITLRSVNGPAVTFIQGCRRPNTNQMDSVARCVYLANGARLSGFTLTNGMTRNSGDLIWEQSGGGLCCQGTGVLASNCVLAGNSASDYGGGVYSGALMNCTLANNGASQGGGAYASALTNCALSGNSAGEGGGACAATLQGCILTQNGAFNGGGVSQSTLWSCGLSGNSADASGGGAYTSTLNNCTVVRNFYGTYACVLTNCIVWTNMGANYTGGLLAYCCTTPLAPGIGNIAADPLLVSFTHLSANSPCRGKARPGYLPGTDIDGEPWVNPPSIGCDEYYAGAAVGPLTVAIQAAYSSGTSSGLTLMLTADIVGAVSSSVWAFGDGSKATNQPYVSHTFPQAGDYTIVLTAYNDSYPGGVSASLPVSLVSYKRHFVVPGNPSPASPYLTWATAATSIQDAVDASFGSTGEEVWVTNGVYATGGRVVYGALTNRLAVTRAVTVRGINGPAVTVIKGYQDPVTTNGDSAVRCVYLGPGAGLVGFTITNGATRRAGDQIQEMSGGGIWTAATNAMVSNCVLVANSAAYGGGGAFSNTMVNCTLTGNSAGTWGGGVYAGTLTNCTLTGNSANLGGGVAYGTVRNCVLTGNTATSSGGGTYFGDAANSALSANSASQGGGAFFGRLTNCTLVANSASTAGGGANGTTLYNSILYYNNAPSGSNFSGGALTYCCAAPLASGTGNFATDPGLANLSHLSAGSPCKGAGSATYAKGKDIDGDVWASPPSVGCDEYYSGASTGPLTVAIQVSAAGISNSLSLALSANINGKVKASVWDFGDGTSLSNAPAIIHTWPQPGTYTVMLTAYNDSNPFGVSVSLPWTLGSVGRLPADWLLKYGLPTDGSADDLDSDGDGLSNRQEWIADTDPTNPASALRMVRAEPGAGGITVSWSSVSTRSYSVERATNLAVVPAFSLLQSNRAGVDGIATFIDTNAVGPGPFFYRVRVEH